MRDWAEIARMEEYARETWGTKVAEMNEENRILRKRLADQDEIINNARKINKNWEAIQKEIKENPTAESLWKQFMMILRLSEPL